jgi:hypothetical protein
LGVLQFAAPRGNGVYTQASNVREQAITTVTKALGFETDIQTPLVFIERADQEINVRV